jgi:DNA-directed RNA polymerase sigma subunit (sigma70/sigma32)
MEKHDPDDPVAVYIREVGNVEPLTQDEETKLFQELGNKGNSDKIRQNVETRLTESRLALVVSVAQKHSASGVPVLELIQEGNLGLMNAVRSFAERQSGDFTSYAATCIEDAITRTLVKSK